MYVANEICQELSDHEIIERSLKEIDYFSCLYERYEEQLLRYIKRMAVVEEEEAEDVLQEAFVKVWKNLNAFDFRMKLSSWLYRIVHNEAISTLRKKTAYGKARQLVLDENSLASEASEDGLDRLLDLEEMDQRTWEILDQLPMSYKEVLVLKFLEGMSYEEISDVLKIPEGTVGTRINRAKKAFRKLSARFPGVFT